MATGTASPPSADAGVAESSQQTQYIQQRLDSTRWQVKLVDLFSGLMQIGIAILAFLLLVAVVDHWVLSLGFWGRFLALSLLVAGICFGLVRSVLPLLTKQINPVYAARMIEEGTPGLKNSLINFLLLRREPETVHGAVMNAVEHRAASDLSRVAPEVTVDRAGLIRVGYCLAGTLVVCVLYAVISPKDPLRTVSRVAFPWADIDRPSRVVLEDVEPGSVDLILGDRLPVSVTVNGIADGEPVYLVFSTADGGVLDRRVPMEAPGGGSRYETTLMPGDGDPLPGIGQDLNYRIEAGDAVSDTYLVEVTPAPTIVVERLEYDFPDYTQMPDMLAVGGGDIEALEGTRVTIHGRANEEIASASLDLFDAASQRTGKLPMTSVADEASRSYVLGWQPDGRTPLHAAYQLRFTSTSGQPSAEPVTHAIRVIRDLAPEVQIITPLKDRVEVRLGARQRIELRGRDPDFGLRSLAVHGRIGDRELFLEPVAEDPQGKTGQVIASMYFEPARRGLKAGDEVIVRGVATDNRHDAQGKWNPNETSTRELTLVVVEGAGGRDAAAGGGRSGGSADDPNNGERAQPSERANPQNATGERTESPGGTRRETSENADGSPAGEEQPTREQTDPQESAQQDSSQTPQQGAGAGGQSDDAPAGQSQSSPGQPAGAGSKSGDSGDQSSDNAAAGGASASESSSSDQTDSGTDGAGGRATDASSGSDGASASRGGPAGESSSDPAGASDSTAGEPSRAGEGGAESGGADGPPPPDHDGEVFDRVMRRIEQGNQGKGNQGNTDRENAGRENGGRGGADQQDDGGANRGDDRGGVDRTDQQGSPNQTGARSGDNPPSGNDGSAGQRSPSDAERGQAGRPPEPGEGGTDGTGEPADSDPNSKPSQRPDGAEQRGDRSNAMPTQDPQGQGGAEQGSQQTERRESAEGGERTPNEEGLDPVGGDPGDRQGADGGGTQPQAGGNQQSAADQGSGEAAQSPDQKQQTPGDFSTDQRGSGQAEKPQSNGSAAQEQEAGQRPGESRSGTQPEAGQEQAGPTSPNRDPQRSNTEGGESGDRSGAGEQGPGQNARQEGHDTAGTSSSSDSGAAGSPEAGPGDRGSRGGDRERGAGGQATRQQGDGSRQRPSENGDRAGPTDDRRQQSENPNRPPPSGDQPPSGPGQQAGGASPGSAAGNPSNGGTQRGSAAGEAVPDGEAANLEYARRATDLVLDYLKDEKNLNDPSLLKDLNMTPDQLRRFLERWEKLRQSARDGGVGDQSEMDDWLKSLGLRPPAQRALRRSRGGNDRQRGLTDRGGASRPPASILDKYNAFRQGYSRGN